jgi:winged helix domain-containing protein/ATPase family protein associated with various cellular activities (AAA)
VNDNGPASASVVETDMFEPFVAPHEHLRELLVRHNTLLKRLVARAKRGKTDALGFVAVSEQEVQHLLDAPPLVDGVAPPTEDLAEDGGSSAETVAGRSVLQLQVRIEARAAKTRAQGARLPLAELAERFALTSREVDLLFACFAVELDRRYERVHGFLHDDMSRRLVSSGVALDLYCETAEEQFIARALLNANARLRHYRMIEMLDDGLALPWLSRSLRIDERIASFLIGDQAIDGRVIRYVTPLQVEFQAGAPKRDDSAKQLAHWLRGLHAGQKPLIYLHGARQAGADAVVHATTQQLGVDVLTVDAELLSETGADFESILFLLFREGILSRSTIYLRNLDRALEQPNGASRYPALLRCLTDMGSIVFASGDVAWCWQLPTEPGMLRIVELQSATVAEQMQAWQAASHRQFSDSELHRLISLHPLPAGAVRDVWRLAQAMAMSNDDGQSQPTFAQLQRACRTRAGTPVSSMARRLDPKHTWDDLVLPSAQLEQLRAICAQARHSSVVFGAWCFDRKMSLGKGLNALFSGPPGSGKTMAAEVIALELGVDILKIDLSQVVSKYIGETEKNLRQLFDQAASANAILFFDEADALLGKRSAVKDAHDRYANTETAYLLQKMEEYPGITMLSTNLRQNMDEAFTRRMRFVVDFPLPEEADRLRIWQTVWPQQVPLAHDVDLPALARQFRLSGGAIRNVALSAAFLAADQGEAVCMQHLLNATKRELQKMGRLVNDDELRSHERSAS